MRPQRTALVGSIVNRMSSSGISIATSANEEAISLSVSTSRDLQIKIRLAYHTACLCVSHSIPCKEGATVYISVEMCCKSAILE